MIQPRRNRPRPSSLPRKSQPSSSLPRNDAYTRCREYMDQAIALVKPGVDHR